MADTQTKPAPVAKTPKSHKYLLRVNAKAGKDGAFNGTCLVFEGDEFYITLNPVNVKKDNGTWELVENVVPFWTDVVDEYPVEVAPQPLRKLVPGEAASQGGLQVRTV